MKPKMLQRILQKQGSEGLFEFLSQSLSGSELNSLLLALFDERVKAIQAHQLLKRYKENRFVEPANLDPIAFRQFELDLLRALKERSFEPIICSPVGPLACASAIATVDQKKVISALRGTEVLSDVSNLLALEVARRKQKQPDQVNIHLMASHRHTRAQHFDLPGFTAHFQVLSMVSAGKDEGDFAFERKAFIHHIESYKSMLQQLLNKAEDDFELILTSLYGPHNRALLKTICEGLTDALTMQTIHHIERPQEDQHYYKGLRFKLKMRLGGDMLEIGDGGIVDWTQKLLQNRKERLLISGIGTEFLFKMLTAESSGENAP